SIFTRRSIASLIDSSRPLWILTTYHFLLLGGAGASGLADPSGSPAGGPPGGAGGGPAGAPSPRAGSSAPARAPPAPPPVSAGAPSAPWGFWAGPSVGSEPGSGAIDSSTMGHVAVGFKGFPWGLILGLFRAGPGLFRGGVDAEDLDEPVAQDLDPEHVHDQE